MGAMTPPSRKSCYNFRVIEINRVVDGDTIDVTIDLGFDLLKKKESELLVLIHQKNVQEILKKKELGYDATNWIKEHLDALLLGKKILLSELSQLVEWVSTADSLDGYTLETKKLP